ncbi:hypothetical protein [Paenibacillus alkalitolerans]|uniref:hypothetical protein n=1 Tax=Paenibacillus alkalitolerans TaxID=2799335 RepID=UPI0018F620F5|nr:hypothetical protein [Paenibacillus alkalitolerans]
MNKVCSMAAILTLTVHFVLPMYMAGDAKSAAVGDRGVEKVYKSGVLERKFRLRSRLNTQLLYKK